MRALRRKEAWRGDTERFGGPSPLSLAHVSLISSAPASWLSEGIALSGFVSAAGSRIKKVFVIKKEQFRKQISFRERWWRRAAGI
jgi:hypothetical protein